MKSKFYVLNIKTLYGANIQKTFDNYKELTEYEKHIKYNIKIQYSEITAYENETEYRKLLYETIENGMMI